MVLGSDDDDFVKEALRDQKKYRQEVNAELQARAKAERAGRRYVRKKVKREEEVLDDETLFHRLRRKLGLTAVEARRIQQESMASMGRKVHVYDDTTLEADTSEDSSEEEEEEIFLGHPHPAAAAVTTEMINQISTLQEVAADETRTDSESEEEILQLSKPAKRPALTQYNTLSQSVPASRTPSEQVSTTPAAPLLSLDEEGKALQALQEGEESEEEVIDLGCNSKASVKTLARPVKIAIGSTQSKTADPAPLEINGQLNGKSLVKAEGTSSHRAVMPDDQSRPCFPLTTEQLATGPLQLDDNVSVPSAINRFLREYQREGVRFFHNCYKEGKGGLLGDDMGLGKTIQVIAFLAAIMKKTGRESSDLHRRINSVRAGRVSCSLEQPANGIWPTCLIVCPASVITNWRDELDTWGYFEHEELNDRTLKDFARGRLDILITSPQLAKRRIELLREQTFSVVFFDECHALKNPRSQLTVAFNSLPCRCRFGLTGTAIQNRFEEFWTLLDWSNPNEFGTLKHWQQLVEEPIRKGQAREAPVEDLAWARRIAEGFTYHLLPSRFLRRTKEVIKAQLPIKRDNIVFCPLSSLQIECYKNILSDREVDMIKKAKDPCPCDTLDEDGLPYQRCKCCFKEDADGRRWNYNMLKYIMLLQRCSNHLALVFPDQSDNIQVDSASSLSDQDRRSRYERQTKLVQTLFPDNWNNKQNNWASGRQIEYCGKWLILRGLMQEWKRNGDKMLLFSLNRRLLDYVSFFVEMEGYVHLRLDGSTPKEKRQGLVNQFNRDPNIFVFLISTTAGGTGLNLTGANKVVIFDPHWNPAHDLQAMDRAYRFKQTRDVDVYRLIGKGSLEEVIYDRQIYKQQLGRIGYEASEERRFFRPDDTKGFVRLFELHETRNVTQDIIKECDLAEATFALQHLVEEADVPKDRMVDEDSKALVGLSANEKLASVSTSTAPSEDVIAKLLHRQGVEYTHLNDKLLGGSRVETAMSKRARETIDPARIASKKPRTSNPGRKPLSEGKRTPAVVSAPVWPPRRGGSSRVEED